MAPSWDNGFDSGWRAPPHIAASPKALNTPCHGLQQMTDQTHLDCLLRTSNLWSPCWLRAGITDSLSEPMKEQINKWSGRQLTQGDNGFKRRSRWAPVLESMAEKQREVSVLLNAGMLLMARVVPLGVDASQLLSLPNGCLVPTYLFIYYCFISMKYNFLLIFK